MRQVAALVAGIRGAENGHAELYKRGTGTRATWYADFEGTVVNSSGANVTLDSNGGFALYVNEAVDVIVKNSLGVTVREFTEGDAAPNLEYQGQSFTGTDYETAATGAGSGFPITAQEIFDLWKTQSGAIDWKVLFDGSATTIRTIVGSLVGLVFNVKNPAYGAVGDGVADDTNAINNAVTAATVAGGIVFFPAGTYRVTSLISIPADVSLLGAGTVHTLITTDHGTAGTVSFTSNGLVGTMAPQFMRGIQLGASQANTGARCNIASGARVVIEQCTLGSSTNSNGYALLIAASATSLVSVRDCRLITNASNSSVMRSLLSGGRAVFERCFFIESNASYTPADAGAGMCSGNKATFIDCEFDGSAAAAGTFTYYYPGSTTLDAILRGCRFLATGGATGTCYTLGSYVAASKFYECEAAVGANLTLYSYTFAPAQKGAEVVLKTRETRRAFITTATNTLALTNRDYGIIEGEITGAFSVNISTQTLPEGARTVVTVRNNSGAARTVDWITAPGSDGSAGTSVSLNDNDSLVGHLVSAVGQIDGIDAGVDHVYGYGVLSLLS